MEKECAQKTLTQIMDLYGDMVFHLCCLHLDHRQDAMDVFQNVFLSLYQSKKQFHDEEHIKAWLISTTLHACIDERRKFWKRHVIALDEMLYPVKEPSQKEVLMYLMKLAAHEKTVLYLSYYQGYQIKEIAGLLHRKENTVKSWMKRGKQHLREMMGGDFDES